MSQKEVTKDQIARLQEVVRAAVDSFCDAEGLELVASKGKYGYKGSITFELAPSDRDEETGVNLAAPEAYAWFDYAEANGFDMDDLGRTFRHNGEEYAIAGWRSRAKKAPVKVVRTRDGAAYAMPVTMVRRGLMVADATIA